MKTSVNPAAFSSPIHRAALSDTDDVNTPVSTGGQLAGTVAGDDKRKKKMRAPIVMQPHQCVADLTLREPYNGARDQSGRFHGRGRLMLHGDIDYTGELFHGRKHGIGMQIWPDGSTFCGEWLHGEAVGYGRLTLPCGGEYFGEVRGGVRHGLGVYHGGGGADGARYFGHWHNGRRHGFGIELGDDGTYTGEWDCDRHHGWGTMQFGATLNRYTGQWRDDTMHGVGSMVWVSLKGQNSHQHSSAAAASSSDGDGSSRAQMLWRRASSNLILGLVHDEAKRLTTEKLSAGEEAKNSGSGSGGGVAASRRSSGGGRRGSLIGLAAHSMLLSCDDMQQYLGEWVNGAPHGNGELRRILLSAEQPDDTQQQQQGKAGNYLNSANNTSNNTSITHSSKKKSSHRSVPFEMGNHFQGTFSRGKREGFGIQYFSDGSAFQGTWQRNLKHGPGTLIRADGTHLHLHLHKDTIVREPPPPVAASAAPLPPQKNASSLPATANNNNNSTSADAANSSSMSLSEAHQQTHVDVNVGDICTSPQDERSVSVTLSLVFVALRHLFHVYVAMQSSCGNFDDMFAAQSYAKLPAGIQARARVEPPAFVATMDEEVKLQTPINHLSDFDGVVHLSETNAEITVELAARAALKAMRTVMQFEKAELTARQRGDRKKSSSGNSSKSLSPPPAAALVDLFGAAIAEQQHQAEGMTTRTPGISSPASPQIITIADAAVPFLEWSSRGSSNGENLVRQAVEDLAAETAKAKKEQQPKSKKAHHQQPQHRQQATDDPFADIPMHDECGGEKVSTSSEQSKSEVVTPFAAFITPPSPSDSVENNNNNNNNRNANPHAPVSIEEVFGQYDATAASGAAAADSSAMAAATGASGGAQRRPLSTVLHLSGLMSLLRDAEVLSPDMTGRDVLDTLEPLLARRAHMPGAPGLTWPAFVEAIVRIAHKRLGLSSLFCAQDITAGSTLGGRVHHFVKEYLHPVLRCVKDMEACPEASTIIGVEQLVVAASENTTLESLRKATLRQLRQMTETRHGRNRGVSTAQQQLQQQQQQQVPGSAAELTTSATAGQAATASNSEEGENSGVTTPRTLSEMSFSPFQQQQQQQGSAFAGVGFELPGSFDEAIAALGQQLQQANAAVSIASAANSSGAPPANATDAQIRAMRMKAPVARGIEILQSLCGTSWAQFPPAVQCDVVEKVQMSGTALRSAGADTIEVWAVAAKPERYSPALRVHFVLVQVAAHTREMRFVGLVPSPVLERIYLQAVRDPEFFISSTKRLLLPANFSTPAEFIVFNPRHSTASNASGGAASTATNSSVLGGGTRIAASHASFNFGSGGIGAAAAAAAPSSVSSSAASPLYQCVRRGRNLILHYIACSSAQQILRGARFLSTAPLMHVDQLLRLYNLCGEKLGPLLHACSFSGLLLYKDPRPAPAKKVSASVLLQQQQQQQQLQQRRKMSAAAAAAAAAANDGPPVAQLQPQQLAVSSSETPGSGRSDSPRSPSADKDKKASGSKKDPARNKKQRDRLLAEQERLEKEKEQMEQRQAELRVAVKEAAEERRAERAAKQFPLSVTEALRHCVHALFGVDAAKAPLFLDARCQGAGLKTSATAGAGDPYSLLTPEEAVASVVQALTSVSPHASSNAFSSNFASRFRSTSMNNTSNHNNMSGGLSSNLNASNLLSSVSSPIIGSPAAAALVVPGHFGIPAPSVADLKRFPEVTEAARAKALQSQRSEQQRLVYHCDNWRVRAAQEEGGSGSESWQLAAGDLRLSFGEFVECVMILCGLVSTTPRQREKPTATEEVTNNAPAAAAVGDKTPSQQTKAPSGAAAGGGGPDTPPDSPIEVNEALRGVMRAATKTIGKQFASTATAKPVDIEAAGAPATTSALTATSVVPATAAAATTATTTTTSAASISYSKTVLSDSALLDKFLGHYLPLLQYCVTLRSAAPNLVPAYWAWAVIDSFDDAASKKQQRAHSAGTVVGAASRLARERRTAGAEHPALLSLTQDDLLDLRTKFIRNSLSRAMSASAAAARRRRETEEALERSHAITREMHQQQEQSRATLSPKQQASSMAKMSAGQLCRQAQTEFDAVLGTQIDNSISVLSAHSASLSETEIVAVLEQQQRKMDRIQSARSKAAEMEDRMMTAASVSGNMATPSTRQQQQQQQKTPVRRSSSATSSHGDGDAHTSSNAAIALLGGKKSVASSSGANGGAGLPKMLAVTKEVQVGALVTSAALSATRIPLVVANQERTAVLDRRAVSREEASLGISVPHPHSLREAVELGLLVDPPPIRFTTQQFQVDPRQPLDASPKRKKH